jgi:hypothetical protein
MRCRYQRQKQIAIFENETRLRIRGQQPVQFAAPCYPPDFHLGFVLEYSSEVRQVYGRIKAAGIAMKLDIGGAGACVSVLVSWSRQHPDRNSGFQGKLMHAVHIWRYFRQARPDLGRIYKDHQENASYD